MNWPAPDPTSPFYLHGPALISFSGGRTSAYMLFMILCAHGGKLPDDVYVVFANTGKEREETLRFVYECGVRWDIVIYWLEWRPRPMGADGKKVPIEDRFEIVGLNSASRDGKPFHDLISRKKYTPNSVTRFCTAEMKIKVMKWFMQTLGYKTWLNVVGLRFDEMHRVMKQVVRNLEGKEAWRSVCPLALAGVMKRHVLRFWLGRNVNGRDRRFPLPQGFDLGLMDYEGNCDGCFLKGFMVLAHSERERPGTLDWWAEEESRTVRFVTEYSYRDIQDYVAKTEILPSIDDVEIGDCTGPTCITNDEEEPIDDGTIAWLIDQVRKAMNEPIPIPAPRAKSPAALSDLFDERQITS